MPFNGSGAYTLPVNSFNPAVAATTINPTDWNSTADDLETGLSTAICKDGQTTTTTRIPFASGISTDSITEVTSTNGVTIAKVNAGLGADIASAGTINLTTATGQTVDVTGTTSITAITLGQGSQRWVRFTGALTLTHGASLILPTGANITTAAGDYALFVGYASSVVRCAYYASASGAPLAPSTTGVTAASTFGTDNSLLRADGTSRGAQSSSTLGVLDDLGNLSGLLSATATTLAAGIAGSALGTVNLSGNTSGTISIKPQAAAGTFNFNLPTGAGTAGQALLSGGGGSSPMTWGSAGIGALSVQSFTANGTYTKPAGLVYALVFATGGGGGGGGGNSQSYGGGGGGAGGTGVRLLAAASIGSTETVTIGAAGSAAGSGSSGGAGGNTTFGALLTGNGGTGGAFADVSAAAAGTGGSASSGDLNLTGGSGDPGSSTSVPTSSGGTGGASFWGGGGRGGSNSAAGGTGTYGSGGGGGAGANAGGTGVAGLVYVLEFKSA